MSKLRGGVFSAPSVSGCAVLVASFALAGQAIGQSSPPPAPGARDASVERPTNQASATIPAEEIWLSLSPEDGSEQGEAPAPSLMRYRWSYSRTDSKTGSPVEIPADDPRRLEINGYRADCVARVRKMYDQQRLPKKIPRQQFGNLQDQAALMVAACVNTLHIASAQHTSMKGVGVVVCEATSDHCWGPADVWRRGRSPSFRR